MAPCVELGLVASGFAASCWRVVPRKSRFPGGRRARRRRPRAAMLPIINEEAFAEKPMRAYRIPTPKPGKLPEQTVIGEMSSHRVRTGETLLDVARYYDLGINEIADANPGVDLWHRRWARRSSCPRQWVLPCCTLRRHDRQRPGAAALLLPARAGRSRHHDRAHLSGRPRARRPAHAQGRLHGHRQDRESHLGHSRRASARITSARRATRGAASLAARRTIRSASTASSSPSSRTAFTARTSRGASGCW